MISTRSVGLVIDTVVCLTLDKWETVSGQFGGYLRVGDKMIYWEEGKCVIFDDTHKHEVWNDTNGICVVLLFDVYRPLPGWLTLVNKTVLNLTYYLPEVRRAARSAHSDEVGR